MTQNKYEIGTFGWLKEQAKKDGFDDIRIWQKQKILLNNINKIKKDIRNIEQIIIYDNCSNNNDREVFYRFWSRVDIQNNTKDCWNWKLGMCALGHQGEFGIHHDKMITSHRMSYMLTKGPIPDGLHVLHLCNNSICCNPNHLELGNHSKNMLYRSKSNRQPIGESTSSAKLTACEVIEIHMIYNEQRRLHPEYKPFSDKSLQPIAKKFHVTKNSIYSIIKGDNWHHIYEEFYQIKKHKIVNKV